VAENLVNKARWKYKLYYYQWGYCHITESQAIAVDGKHKENRERGKSPSWKNCCCLLRITGKVDSLSHI